MITPLRRACLAGFLFAALSAAQTAAVDPALLAKANAGDVKAQLAVGEAYETSGTKSDYAEAAAWYRKAADKNSIEAQIHLAVCYRDGRGVTRDMAEAANWYRKADLFVLPTLSDGFAITQLEAMSHGLPVITTPCCGEVVSDGVDGFIVAPRDAEALAKTFLRYLAEPGLLRSHQTAAFAKSKQFTLERLAGNLRGVEEGMGDGREK